MKKALNNLVLQGSDLIENLTAIHNRTSAAFETMKDISSSLAKPKQPLPTKNQLLGIFNSLLENHEQETKAKSKLGWFMDNLKEVQNALNDPHGLDNAFTALVTTALLKSSMKKLQDDYGKQI